jgi:hypothetical protein
VNEKERKRGREEERSLKAKCPRKRQSSSKSPIMTGNSSSSLPLFSLSHTSLSLVLFLSRCSHAVEKTVKYELDTTVEQVIEKFLKMVFPFFPLLLSSISSFPSPQNAFPKDITEYYGLQYNGKFLPV